MENYIWNIDDGTKDKVFVLIIYDLTDDKRRSKFAKMLEGYGFRVQKSAFEAILTDSQVHRLERSIATLIDEETDSVRIYRMTSFGDVHLFGQNIQVRNEEVIIV